MAERVTVGQLLGVTALAAFGVGFGAHALFHGDSASASPTPRLGWFEEHRSSRPDRENACEIHGPGFLGVELRRVTVPLAPMPPDLSTDGTPTRHCGKHRRHAMASGVEVARVLPGSAAEAAGIEVGDRLLAVDAVRTTSPLRAARVIGSRCPGDAVRIELARGDQTLTLEAELAPR